jgi:hypothetical protein
MTQDFSDVPTDTNNPAIMPEENSQTTDNTPAQGQQ